MNVKIHTQGWVGDRSTEEDEEATVSIHCLLELDGIVYDAVSRAAIICSNQDFTKLVVTLIPGSLETVVHDKDSWEELCAYARNRRTNAYRGKLPWRRDRRSPT